MRQPHCLKTHKSMLGYQYINFAEWKTETGDLKLYLNTGRKYQHCRSNYRTGFTAFPGPQYIKRPPEKYLALSLKMKVGLKES